MTIKAANPVEKEFLDQLVAHRLLMPTGVQGLYGRSGVFESIIDGIDNLVTRTGKADNADVWRFPPVVTRKNYEKSEHLKSFPDLVGSVHSFRGNDAGHQALLAKLHAGEDWSRELTATEVIMTPAACYPIYPTLTGTLPDNDGKLFDVMSYCFRHEPSGDPARMQMFRMHEHVRVGSPGAVKAWRDIWFDRAQEVVAKLGIPAVPAVANDPFFGRGGKMMKVNQREQELKFEFVVPVCSTENPTAIISLNMHMDHFGHIFGIKTKDGEWAHTSCIGFGLERTALAMLKTHGLSPKEWPKTVRENMGL